MTMPATVFVRIGWMETYKGSETGEMPKGGGKNNQLGLGGGEKDNFLSDAYGRLHGYFAVGKGGHSIDLFRVDGRPETKKLDQLSPVLVIFVATHPDGGSVIVGWYRNAMLYRSQQPRGDGTAFRVEANAQESHLLLEDQRTFFLPRPTRALTSMGHSNIFYVFDRKGSQLSLPWVGEALEKMATYEAINTSVAETTNSADPTTAAEIQEERKAGYASNPKVRRAVEKRAMCVVMEDYAQRGITVHDRSTNHPYDYAYAHQNTDRFIEVKGSQQPSPTIILTRNEVEFARANSDRMELCVVHSIVVNQSDEPIATGGVLKRFPQWNPESHQLAELQYQCKLSWELGEQDGGH